MSAQPYHKRYHGDALTGFMALTLEERGAYQTILDLIYDRGGALPDNPRLLAGYMGCSLRKWTALRSILLTKGKIYLLADGSISNKRAEKEIENYAKTSRKLAENGAKGGRNKRESQEKGNENSENENQGLKPGSSLPEARSQKEGSVAEATGVPPPDQVKAVFELGVSILMAAGSTDRAARSLVGKWRSRIRDPELSRLLMLAQSKSDPAAWLTKAVEGERTDANALYDSIDRKYG